MDAPAPSPAPDEPAAPPAAGASEAAASQAPEATGPSGAPGEPAPEPPLPVSSPAPSLELLPPELGVSPPLAAALGWLVPGLGQIALGRTSAGLVLLATIGGLFLGGLALTDFTAVEPREHQLEFVAQALIGGPTALALGLTQGLQLERMPPWLDVGRLFVVVSGLLNLIALCDAWGEAARRNAQARAEYERRRSELFAPPALPAPATAQLPAQPPEAPPGPAPSAAPDPVVGTGSA